ncbi:hypothetical protein OSB04_006426 [Centaurea solstitialis]|uniref:Uncharacterized protein n=1 Tax=Centaurea solstitialis TaxID=347529 RepID=A0AA38TTG4_9ASTR|nr:hypothetical protein OSB04_006426 [Centaurea solstitialis]
MELKIETTLTARNLEARVYGRGGIEDATMWTSKRFQMPYLKERISGDCLCDGYQERKMFPTLVVNLNVVVDSSWNKPIAKKIQKVENVYKDYTIEIFEVEFQINLIPIPTKEIGVMINMDWLSWN